VLAEHASVSAIFWLLFGVAAVLFAGVVVLVPETPRGASTRPDWIGSFLLVGALVSFLLAVSKANAWGWSSAKVVILIVAAVLLLIAFIAYERSTAAPLIDMHLLARRPAWSANLVAFAMGFALFIAGIVVPQIATLPSASDYGLGLTYTQTGLVLLPGALAIVVGGWAAGVLVGRLGARSVVAVGALAAAIGYAFLAAADRSVAVVVIGNVPVGLGIGLVFAALTNLVVHSVDRGSTSAFAATTAVSRSTGAALGTQIAAAIVISAGAFGQFPADEGFTRAFVLGLIAAVVALGATAAIPASSSDPLVARSPMVVRGRSDSPA
jgi:Na+/melibiose symporter-like transporter